MAWDLAVAKLKEELESQIGGVQAELDDVKSDLEEAFKEIEELKSKLGDAAEADQQ
mgnify:CR=1 FL=1